MGIETMETESVDKQAVDSTYSIISFVGTQLPDSYRNMIYSKWMRSLKHGNDYYQLIDNDSYYSTYRAYIDVLLAKPGCVVKLAVLTEDHDVCLGFSVSRGDILDYVHVHKDMRKQGIATALVPKDFKWITHLTKIGLSIWGSKLQNVKFNPFC